jgi:signal transduction histidine kinase
MSLALVFEWVLVLTACCATTTAIWLWWHARFRPLLTSLAGFCLMLALWSFGHLALLHQFPLLGKAFILANPLMPTFYLQFALHFVVDQRSSLLLQRLKNAVPWLFLTSILVVLLSWGTSSATVQPAAQLPQFFLFQRFGWLNLAYTVALGVLAHWVLWCGWRQHQGNKRRSIAAISMTAALGLLLASSFVFPSIGLDWYPYPMLLLPGYLLLLVYSVVRYQMLAVNAFASRALLMLVMALLLLLLMALISVLFGQFGMPALAAVPGWQLWLYSSLLLLLAAACYQPASRLAERLIYPGVQLNQPMVSQWQQQLSQAADWQQLSQQALVLLQQPLQQPLWIEISAQGQLLAKAGNPQALVQLRCQLLAADWQLHLKGQDELTPSMRLTSEVFGSLLQSSCTSLHKALALAAAEKQRLSQQHLVELGALAAAMAHELRNPLNIISMASAGVDAELRGHIQSQLKRADRLIADMLVYAGKLQIQPQRFLLQTQLQSLLPQFDWQQVKVRLQLPADLSCEADPHRLQQVLINLLDNALAFLRNQPGGELLIEASSQPDAGHAGVLIRLHNNGPALDASLLDTLFRPFVSKRAGGSGLGLAIVQRIVSAHQGRICHRNDLGWPVSFEIWLPQKTAAGVVG